MIPVNSNTFKVETNVSEEDSGDFTVDADSMSKIMSVLTNLYTDPEGAVVREYLTNAFDSQVEAQEKDPHYVWKPIEVSTPSRFSQAYVIRDFGVGMDETDIVKTYSKYGKSTKESSNSVVGMLGLGSKCALTYTNQFTITGYKNGVRTRALITKSEKGAPRYNIVDKTPTDEPNGVEISVPVRDANSFGIKTADFLRWWPEGLVTVDGRDTVPHGLEKILTKDIEFSFGGVKVTEPVDIFLLPNSNKSYVVMGNVPYAIDSRYVNSDLQSLGYHFVAYVPIGVVEFPPSREELTYTTQTVAVLDAIGEGLFDSVYDKHVETVANSTGYFNAMQKYQNLPHRLIDIDRRKGSNARLAYKGHLFNDIGRGVNLPAGTFTLGWSTWSDKYQYHASHSVDPWRAMNVVFVIMDDPNIKHNYALFKRKVKHWVNENHPNFALTYLLPSDVDNVWLSEVPRVNATTIKAVKLPSNNDGPRTETPYDYHWLDKNGDYKYESALKPPVKGNVVYVSPQDIKTTYRKQGTDPRAILKQIGSGHVLVVLGKNRFEKFLRTHPNAVTLGKVLRDRVTTLANAVSKEEKIAASLDNNESEFLKKANVANLKDPRVADLAKVVKAANATDKITAAQNLARWARKCDVSIAQPSFDVIAQQDNPFEDYPLVRRISSFNMPVASLTDYINAMWESKNK